MQYYLLRFKASSPVLLFEKGSFEMTDSAKAWLRLLTGTKRSLAGMSLALILLVAIITGVVVAGASG